MDTNKMRDISREQFEQRYPVPEGCCWNVKQGRYVLFHLKLCTLGRYEEFIETWVCWQASREAVVIELESHCCYDRPGDAYEVLQDCKAAIEAQGLKVAS